MARIHKARFCTSDTALAHCSVSLISKFYASFLGRYLFLVHDSGRGVDGYVVGGEREGLIHSERTFIGNHLAHCCWEMLSHPRLWPIVIRSVRKAVLTRSMDFVAPLAPELPRLLTLAVAADAEGSGVATTLVKAFESTISSRYSGYWLTVAKTNLHAVRFYERLGMTIVVDAFPSSFMFQKEIEPADGGDPPQP